MIILTNKIWKTICDVNRYWNWKIEYVSDKEHYGRLDFWTYPNDDKGDCEDYAIAKKRDLGSKKIPAYLATCRTEKGILHAVVLVDTDRGTFCLDNRKNQVWHYQEMDGYVWEKREWIDGKWYYIACQ